MKYKKIIIYGGTSEISLELINLYINECDKIIIFCRLKRNFVELIKSKVYFKDLEDKLEIFEVDLL